MKKYRFWRSAFVCLLMKSATQTGLRPYLGVKSSLIQTKVECIMRLVDSSDTSYLFDISDQQEDCIDEIFHEWCEAILGEKATWVKQDQQIEITDPELALKFKLRWALEE